ncbi:putative D-aminoacylase [Cadophora sp. DSE1049]|nr:putative D-aminoacylase [Cadophora sp. DSE1049]
MRNLTEIFQLLAPIVSEISTLAGVPGVSVGIIHHNEVVFQHNYGFLDLEAKIPVTNDTVYPIGSLTKGFTAATIASLVEDGILEWNSPIKQILPNFRSQWSEVNDLTTILDLLSMQTGLSGADSVWCHAPPVIDNLQIMEVFSSLPQAKPFRSTIQYNNLGYALASSAVESRTGQSLIINLKQRILEPLGMYSTDFDTAGLAPDKVSKTYVVMEDGTPQHFTRSLVDENSWIAACGGLWSSTNDLLVYYKALLQSAQSQFMDSTTANPQSPLKQVATLLTGHTFLDSQQKSLRERSYGLGWVRTQLPGILGAVGYNEYFVSKMPVAGTGSAPRLAVYRQGNLPSASAAVYMFPETSSAVVVLCNAFGLTDAPDWIAQLFVEKLFDDSTNADYAKLAREAVQRTLEQSRTLGQELSSLQDAQTRPKDLKLFVGRYYNSFGTFFLDIRMTDGQLSVAFQGLKLETYSLKHSHENVFSWYTSSDDLTRRG